MSVNGIATFGNYPIGPPLDLWALVAEVDGQFYLIENNTRRLFASWAAFERFNFNMVALRKDFTEELLAEVQDGGQID